MGSDRSTEGSGMKASDIIDLRTALAFLAEHPGQLLSTSVEVDPYLELPAVYRRVGAGTPTPPPTKLGPAMLFEKVKGSEMRVLTGILASRERTALLLGSSPERLAFDLLAALERPVPPVVIAQGTAPCQEVVFKPPFDVRTLIPQLVSTKRDTGAFLNMALMRGEDPETGVSDVTIHRMCFHGPDTLSVSFNLGRHIGFFLEKAWAMGKPLPVSVNMGFDPAIYVATSFEAPTTPLGFDELTIAGGLRGRPVELVDCLTQPAKAIARAEIVLEGEFRPNEVVNEDALTGSGWAMPEFPGYVGTAQPDLPVLARHRRHPPLRSHLPVSGRSGRGARDPGRTAHRGQHLPPGGGRHAGLPPERVLPFGRRWQVPGHPADQEAQHG